MAFVSTFARVFALECAKSTSSASERVGLSPEEYRERLTSSPDVQLQELIVSSLLILRRQM